LKYKALKRKRILKFWLCVGSINATIAFIVTLTRRFRPRNDRVVIIFVTLFSVFAFRRSVLVDSEIELFDFVNMKAKVFQNRTQTGFSSVFDDVVDGAITIVTQTGIGGPMDIR